MEGRVLGGRYRLDRLLGRGAMGSVWAGEHLALGTPIAVKLIQPELAASADARARFDREARAAARLRSTHVVQTLDQGVDDDGTPYIVMERLEGENLRSHLVSHGRLSPAATARILFPMARALSRAHAAGIVHRDLKPENVFLAREGDDVVVKVLDFGVVKVADVFQEQATITGMPMGTPLYMSPEQAQGLKTVDFRSDLWSLGVVAFECLTGVKPFDATSPGELFRKITVDTLPTPTAAAPDAGLTPAIDAWMARALARDPGDRFAGAREEVEAFAEAAGLRDARWSERGDDDGASVPSAPPAASREAPEPTSPVARVVEIDTLRSADGPRGRRLVLVALGALALFMVLVWWLALR